MSANDSTEQDTPLAGAGGDDVSAGTSVSGVGGETGRTATPPPACSRLPTGRPRSDGAGTSPRLARSRRPATTAPGSPRSRRLGAVAVAHRQEHAPAEHQGQPEEESAGLLTAPAD